MANVMIQKSYKRKFGHTSTKCAHKAKIPKEKWASRQKCHYLSILAEHLARQHAQAIMPSSEDTAETIVMTQPFQVPPLQTNQINENNEIRGFMNTQVGVINAPIAGVHSHKPTLI